MVDPQIARAELMLTCTSLSGSELTGAQNFFIECTISSDIIQGFTGTRLDFACTLSQLGGASGLVSLIDFTADPDGDGSRGPGLQGDAYLFLGSGLAIPNFTLCTIVGIFGLGNCITIPMDQTRYLVTATYEVSPCAKGDFAGLLENYSDPPVDADVTELRDCVNALIPFTYNPPTFTVVTGSCCTGLDCIEDDINEFCCTQNHPGARWFEGRSCDDPVACPCLLASDCDDDVTCTDDACNPLTGLCESVPIDESCSDGLFCNGGETCHATLGCQLAAPLTCDDDVACTVDSCDVSLDACMNIPSNAACDDQLFCNGQEACNPQLGCVAGQPPCPAELDCDKATDTCVVPPIPTVSTWGLITLALAVLTLAKLGQSKLPSASA